MIHCRFNTLKFASVPQGKYKAYMWLAPGRTVTISEVTPVYSFQ
jgi:hypothetical protein